MIVFSEDTYFDDHVEKLAEISTYLFSLKGMRVEEPEIKIIADAITDEMTALYYRDLPKKITNDKLVYCSTIMVHRAHLPGKYLQNGLIPLLICPTKTVASIILPSKYWAPELAQIWTEGY